MKVMATEKGYYGGQIRVPGDTFTISDKKHFSKNWMVSLGTADPVEPVDDGQVDDGQVDPVEPTNSGKKSGKTNKVS